MNISAVLGLLVLVGISANTVVNKVLPTVTKMISNGSYDTKLFNSAVSNSAPAVISTPIAIAHNGMPSTSV